MIVKFNLHRDTFAIFRCVHFIVNFESFRTCLKDAYTLVTLKALLCEPLLVSLGNDRNDIWHNFGYVCRHISILVMLLQCLDPNLYLQNKIKLAHIRLLPIASTTMPGIIIGVYKS